MKTNNADSPKIQLKPPALPVSYERITKPPTWVDVRPIAPAARSHRPGHLGERAAKALAETQACRFAADRRGRGGRSETSTPAVTGTLGVLRSGAEQDLVKVPDLLERLKATSFAQMTSVN